MTQECTITAYQIANDANCMKFLPGNKRRQWMDDTPNSYAYRCLPLQIANCTGWDIFPPCDFVVNWSGGEHQDDLTIHYEDDKMDFGASSFGSGIATFHTGYMFRTNAGWDTLVTGPINETLPWGTPLTGITETWWLDFTFTINIKLNEPGWFEVSRKNPLARMMVIPHNPVVKTDMKIMKNEKEQNKLYCEWAQERSSAISDMNEAFDRGEDFGSVKIDEPTTHWEKNYYLGKKKSGKKVDGHVTKLRYPTFKGQ